MLSADGLVVLEWAFARDHLDHFGGNLPVRSPASILAPASHTAAATSATPATPVIAVALILARFPRFSGRLFAGLRRLWHFRSGRYCRPSFARLIRAPTTTPAAAPSAFFVAVLLPRGFRARRHGFGVFFFLRHLFFVFFDRGRLDRARQWRRLAGPVGAQPLETEARRDQ